MKNMNKYENCLLCPRKCGINRRTGQTGICGVSSEIKVARAALHYWEEPCISGKRGSGAVFFSGCSLHCVFCQNREISDGKEVNFPGCKLSECKGILRDRIPAKHQFYQDDYVRTNHADGSFSLRSKGVMTEKAEEGTDISALLNNFISIGSVRCAALGYQKD